MSVQIDSKGPSHLLALGLSQQALHLVNEMRQACWQVSGDISFLSLPPLIPLLWSKDPLIPFEQVKLPLLPEQCTFSQLIEEEHSLFLGTEDAQWAPIVEEIVTQYLPSKPTESPFPSFPGIYLGANSLPEEQVFSAVTTNDWRLFYYRIEWKSNTTQRLLALHYEILSDRHLLTH